MEDWKISPDRRRQTIEMIKMHVLLTVPETGAAETRSFDHPEFRDYFLAQSLVEYLLKCASGSTASGLGRFLAAAQLPDSVARFSAGLLDEKVVSVQQILSSLASLVTEEWRPTFLQTNVGTLVPYLLSKFQGESRLKFDAKVVYASLVFEGLPLRNVTIAHGSFLHPSFRGVDWSDVVLSDCDLTELILDRQASYENVRLDNCKLNG